MKLNSSRAPEFLEGKLVNLWIDCFFQKCLNCNMIMVLVLDLFKRFHWCYLLEFGFKNGSTFLKDVAARKVSREWLATL